MISCKTNHTVNCDAYGENKFIVVPYIDTLIIDSYHFHIEKETTMLLGSFGYYYL